MECAEPRIVLYEMRWCCILMILFPSRPILFAIHGCSFDILTHLWIQNLQENSWIKTCLNAPRSLDVPAPTAQNLEIQLLLRWPCFDVEKTKLRRPQHLRRHPQRRGGCWMCNPRLCVSCPEWQLKEEMANTSKRFTTTSWQNASSGLLVLNTWRHNEIQRKINLFQYSVGLA